MKMRLLARGVEVNTDLKEHVERQVQFTLGRFAPRIKSLTIRLTDANGPRGGIDQCCQVTINAGLSRRVIVSEQRASIHAAVTCALECGGRALRRQLDLGGRSSRRAAKSLMVRPGSLGPLVAAESESPLT